MVTSIIFCLLFLFFVVLGLGLVHRVNISWVFKYAYIGKVDRAKYMAKKLRYGVMFYGYSLALLMSLLTAVLHTGINIYLAITILLFINIDIQKNACKIGERLDRGIDDAYRFSQENPEQVIDRLIFDFDDVEPIVDMINLMSLYIIAFCTLTPFFFEGMKSLLSLA